MRPPGRAGGPWAHSRPAAQLAKGHGPLSLLCILFSLVYLTLSLALASLIWPGARAATPQAHRATSPQPNPFLIYAGPHQERAGARRQPAPGPQPRADSLLVCPDGWHQHSTQCYKFIHQRHSWQRAKDICERHGAQLALIYDYQQNNFTSQLAGLALSSPSAGVGASVGAPGHQADPVYQLKQAQLGGAQPLYASDERSYWIGFRAIDRLETNTLESAANTFVSKYIGFWDYDEPRVSQGECVRATVRSETGTLSPASSYKLIAPGEYPAAGVQASRAARARRQARAPKRHAPNRHAPVRPRPHPRPAGQQAPAGPQQVWQLAPCEDLLPFVCQRQVCSSNSFHCANGRCVNGAWKCDGHNDCGDDSDEMDCPRRCRFYMASSGDKVQSVNYPQRYEPNADCKWTLEGPLDAGMVLQFYEFDTERHFDQVQVLAGARTDERAFSLATFSGQLNLTSRPFVTGSNLMIVKFRSDALVERRGFRASWKTEPIECGGEL